MANNQILNISKIDFTDIKNSFKEFLRQKPEMQDYDFEGSGWNYLLDILAYNTAYNSFYLNMISNEMFLDSAQQRNNIISKAKLLGYMPESVHSSRAKIRVEFTPDSLKPLPQQIYVPKETAFVGIGTDEVSYEFVVVEPQTLYYINPSGAPSDYDSVSGKFFREFEIIEGVRLTYRYTITSNPEQRIIIPNPNVDTSSIKVWVQTSVTNIALTPYNSVSDITEIESDSKVYYLQYNEDELCEIYFGDGVISSKLESGNIVIVEYIVSRGGINANGIKTFSAIQNIGIPSPDSSGISVETITTIMPSYGAKDQETNNHIKYYAPINYEMQNRAVTELDFQQLIIKKYSQIDSISVWGGEENNPVQYGKVFISIKPSVGYVLDNEDKDYIINDIIRPRCVVTQEPVIVDPDYLYIIINSLVKFDFRNSIKSKQDIQYAVYETISNYSNEQLEKFQRGFVYSDFITKIDETDPGIYSNLTSISLKKIIYPTLGIQETYNITFANELDNLNVKTNIYRKSIYSSSFYYLNNYTACLFAEDSFSSNILSLFQINSNNTLTKLKEVGTINSLTGEISISELIVPYAWVGNMNHIEFYALPKYYDINSSRNLIMVIDGQDIHVVVENK